MATVIQWNIRGLRANYSELELLVDTFKPVAFCLQELLISDSYTFQNRQYTFIKKLPDTDTPTGGSGILIRKDIPHSEIKLDSPLQAVACRISLPEPISLCSVYLPPSSNWNSNDLLSLVCELPPPVILMGDFNSHSTLWGCNSTNRKGLEVETFLIQSNLCLLNNKSATYLHPATGTLSSLDLAFCDSSLYLNYTWSVYTDLCGSDHYPTIIAKPAAEAVDDCKRWQLARADWGLFEDHCSRKLNLAALNTSVNLFNQFTSTLINIAEKTIPKTCGKLKMRQKPWFNEDCKSAIRSRKAALKEFLKDPSDSNLETVRVLRAKARRTIKQCKRDSWRSYVSKLNAKTAMNKVWIMVKRISGKYQPSTILHLEQDNNKIEHPQDIANTLASTISFNSSHEHYSKSFQKLRTQQEKHTLNFNSDNSELYNQLFSLSELHDALRQSHDTAVGPDDIHYQMLKHLPYTSLSSLLHIFNDIWQTGSFPPSWSEATLIPLPKPDKDHTCPNNYRPIALTSCLCKTFERMVNNRLMWYLENNRMLTELQSGFRKGRSTTDQLVRLESFVREAFVRGEHATAVFFDMEKAYDTTWKYGILKDLRDAGLTGRLATFISNFLSNRKFNVRVGQCLSNTYKQEMGVPQGSILSVALFILKINNIVKCLPPGVRGSLFVDDFLICYRSKSMHCIERVLQGCLQKIELWADSNGFQFSKSKTVCMHFCRKHILHPEPSLKIYNTEIPVVTETKFLGIIFDNKLTFRPHIAYLKKKCLKAINLLRVVAHTDWGADGITLLKLYRSLVRSKLDYGCVVYGSARASYLETLDRVQNAALRVCLGAFRTTPICSLHVEANELPLSLRRQKLALNYIIKLSSNADNPAYSSVFQPNYTSLFDHKPNTISTLGLRLSMALSESGVNISQIAPHLSTSTPPWLLRAPHFDYSLYNVGTKSDTPPDLYLCLYNRLVSENYEGYIKIFTDGSKQGVSAAAAAVTVNKVLVKRLPNHASIFSAEAIAILLALDIISESSTENFLILTDSLSCVTAIDNRNLQNTLVVDILERIHEQSTLNRKITFVWVPSHIGIAGNTAADAIAKSAVNLQISNIQIPYTDFKPLVSNHANTCWQRSWNSNINSKLFKITPTIKPYIINHLPRRDEVLIHRLRMGHTYLTHSYLLHRENPPECDVCRVTVTVEHLLLYCSKYDAIRQKFYNVDSLRELFQSVKPHIIVAYVKEIGLYRKL